MPAQAPRSEDRGLLVDGGQPGCPGISGQTESLGNGFVYEANIDRPHGFAAIEIKHVASYFRVAYYLPAVKT